MRSLGWWLCLAVAVLGLAILGSASVARAQENKDELQREHIMPPRPERVGKPAPLVVVPTPAMEDSYWHVLHEAKCILGTMRFIGFVLVIVHILLAVWVYLDIRKRAEGHGIFIALVLLAGLPAAILYALVRIGDRVGEKKA